MNSTPISKTAWTQIGTGLSNAILQSNVSILAHVGSDAPNDSDLTGFSIGHEEVFLMPGLDTFGGSLWVRVSPTDLKSDGILTHAQ